MGMFKNELQQEIRVEVRLMKSRTLKELMDSAFKVEGKNAALKKAKEEKKSKGGKNQALVKWIGAKPTYSKYTSSHETQQSINSTPIPKSAEGKDLTVSKTSSNWVNVPITTSSSNYSSNKSSKRLSKAEINRKELGLCFKCEEKFSPSHRCKGKQLRMLVVEEEEEEDPGGYVVEEVEEDIHLRKYLLSWNSHLPQW